MYGHTVYKRECHSQLDAVNIVFMFNFYVSILEVQTCQDVDTHSLFFFLGKQVNKFIHFSE